MASFERVVGPMPLLHSGPKFFEARKEDPVRAGIALSTIRELFRVDREVQPPSPEDQARERRRCLGGTFERFKEQPRQWSTTCRPKSGMGKAITYARRRWDTLVVFLDDCTAPPHNNTSERLLRSLQSEEEIGSLPALRVVRGPRPSTSASLFSHQSNSLLRAKPESVQTGMGTSGQRARMAATTRCSSSREPGAPSWSAVRRRATSGKSPQEMWSGG